MALAFQRGEPDAYRVIYERYRSKVQAICMHMLREPEDAREAAQDTFVRVYQGLGRFNGRYQLGAWISRIASNVCLDHIRASSRRPLESRADDELDTEPAGPADQYDPETLQVRKERADRIRRHLRSLPPSHRKALMLRDYEGRSYAEIAVILELTECQVKALIHRARKGFRRGWREAFGVAFLPWRSVQRLFHRGRELEGTAGQVASSAAPSVQAVANCATALQHCGAAAGERAISIVTAGFIGAAALTGGLATRSLDPPNIDGRQGQRVERAASVSISNSEGLGTSTTGARNDRGSGAQVDSEGTAAPEEIRSETQTPTEEPGSAQPGPTPTPSPSPSTSPQDPKSSPPEGGSSSGGKTGGDKRSTPPPSDPVVGWESSSTLQSSEPRVDQTTVDCLNSHVRQHLEVDVWYGGQAYPGVIDLDLAASSSLEVRIVKDGYEVYYTGGGSRTLHSRTDDLLDLEYRGRYGTGSDNAAYAGLPRSGAFRIKLAVDCEAVTVVTERLLFATE